MKCFFTKYQNTFREYDRSCNYLKAIIHFRLSMYDRRSGNKETNNDVCYVLVMFHPKPLLMYYGASVMNYCQKGPIDLHLLSQMHYSITQVFISSMNIKTHDTHPSYLWLVASQSLVSFTYTFILNSTQLK